MGELIGMLLVVQGGGGLLNRLLGASSPSWFVQCPCCVAASVVMVLTGAAVLVTGRGRKRPE
ncbi:MAG: hypothetical protein QOI78_3117 [Actinomycetota bacterium]|jgi:hypothetical protein|nr:hypothetical protein [Actinomycetota bacterium]